MPSYAYLCKKAGLPAPTGFAKIDRAAAPPRKPSPPPPTRMTPDFIEHTIQTFIAVCTKGQSPGPNLGKAIVDMLDELKRLKS